MLRACARHLNGEIRYMDQMGDRVFQRFSLKKRVFLVCGGLVLIFAAGGLYWLGEIQEEMVRDASRYLGRQSSVMKELLRSSHSQWSSLHSMDPLADWLGSGFQLRVTLMLPDGKVVGDSQVPIEQIPLLENHGDRMEVREALRSGSGSSIRYSNTLGVDLLYVASLIGSPEDPQMVVRVAMPLEEVYSASQKGRMMILAGTILALALSLLAAHLVAMARGKELEDLAKKIRQMTEEDLEKPEGLYYQPSEVSRVERALETLGFHMAAKIRELKEARDSMETLIQGMVEGVLLTDDRGKILLVNKALFELMEPRVDPIGRTAAEVFRKADLQEALESCISQGQSQSLEIRTSGTSTRALEVQVAPVGEKGAVAVFHDVTERRRIEQIRRDLVASASHELKTPLAAVRASVETLLEGALEDPPQARRFLEIVQRHVLRLEKILGDLLELSKLESGTGGPKRDLVRLGDLAETALEAVTELAQGKGLQLLKRLPQTEVVVQGNQRQLEQALVNLLENAVNYTEAGGSVSLEVGLEGKDAHIVVEDTGVGIPQEHLPRIFERFYRVDKNRSRGLGGTGLGLSIVKHVAQSHGGRVEVESTVGKGSIFRIILPAFEQPGLTLNPPLVDPCEPEGKGM